MVYEAFRAVVTSCRCSDMLCQVVPSTQVVQFADVIAVLEEIHIKIPYQEDVVVDEASFLLSTLKVTLSISQVQVIGPI